MSSSGKEKFEKYFSGLKTKTVLKNPSQLLGLDCVDLGISLPKGTEITVLGEEYHPKVFILYQGEKYRVKLADVEKPIHLGKTVPFRLKPDKLGIAGKFKTGSYAAKVVRAIEVHPDIPPRVRRYLMALVLQGIFPAAIQDVPEAFKALNNDSSLLNSINSDFMEVLGPLLVLNERPELLGGEIYFPENGNEPLFDFSITKDGKVHLFSSKNGIGNVNTLKASIVYDRVIGNAKLRKKFSKEIELLRIIKATRTKQTPDIVNEWLAKEFTGYIPKAAAEDAESIVLLERYVVNFINSSSMNFLPLVKAALPDVTYVRANIDSSGFPVLKSLTHGEAVQRAVFRSKSSPGHITDKLGFDV